MIAPATNNLRLWERHCVTPPAATKSFKKGGWQGTDINPAYRLRCLTELFGPQGTGWGWTIHERWREDWPSRVKDGDQWVDYMAPCAFVMLSLWYIEGGERKECSPQIGGTECDLAPDEVWKMSITDAIGKCCLALGIAADVYLGQFDGKYRDGHGERRESKTRPSLPACPKCNKPDSIIAGKAEYGAGLLCYKAKGGCGHSWETPEHPFNEHHKGKKSNGSPPADDPFTSSEGSLFDSLHDAARAVKDGKALGIFLTKAMKAFHEKQITAPQFATLTGSTVANIQTDKGLNWLGKWIADARVGMSTEDAKCFDDVEALIQAKVEQLAGAAA
jgi:hypothetical protein